VKLPTTITVPGLAAVLDEFLRPHAATAGDGVEIRQDDHGTTVSACEGRHAATIRTTAAGSLEPILVDPAALAGGDPAGELKLYRMTETSVVAFRPDGELASVTVRPGTLSRSARDLADVVEGEIASGSTDAVFELDPRHILAIARGLVAAGVEKTTVAFAPRWNVLAVAAETATLSAMFLVAGESLDVEPQPAATEQVDPLDFTIGRRSPAETARRRPKIGTVSGIKEDEVPF
jgi:hypothetical protein